MIGRRPLLGALAGLGAMGLARAQATPTDETLSDAPLRFPRDHGAHPARLGGAGDDLRDLLGAEVRDGVGGGLQVVDQQHLLDLQVRGQGAGVQPPGEVGDRRAPVDHRPGYREGGAPYRPRVRRAEGGDHRLQGGVLAAGEGRLGHHFGVAAAFGYQRQHRLRPPDVAGQQQPLARGGERAVVRALRGARGVRGKGRGAGNEQGRARGEGSRRASVRRGEARGRRGAGFCKV